MHPGSRSENILMSSDGQVRNRKRRSGLSRCDFTEGWVEFRDKRVAKRVAASLHNTPMGTRKRQRFFHDLWSIKVQPTWQQLTSQSQLYLCPLREANQKTALCSLSTVHCYCRWAVKSNWLRLLNCTGLAFVWPGSPVCLCSTCTGSSGLTWVSGWPTSRLSYSRDSGLRCLRRREKQTSTWTMWTKALTWTSWGRRDRETASR